MSHPDSLKQFTSSQARQSFRSGCIDSLPICFTFVFLFFSIGAASQSAGFTAVQSVLMTLAVHASPLQVLITQNAESLSFLSLLFATLVINFRFLIMSSLLTKEFGNTALSKQLLSVQLLSISTFTLANSQKEHIADLYHYYLGCGIITLVAATLATLAGFWVGAEQHFADEQLINMILPIHFTALAALAWPKLRPLLVTGMGFVVTPFAERWLGEYQILITPLLLAGLWLLWEVIRQGKAHD
ncbi:AzlC family ABC transporter permease [Pseudomonas sp. 5P_3.1_Bac2]|uniref:AzlC family ABC transporter permease n=1 Tax=Pseudomonas sp. 5P_3.1_Bac2 TaxID=2971617 RepID=UPI0021CA5EDB|nr:AzlC family ABC transporter permease [Pseudomonas sp. 5P_3.1_Bac2]MCU1717138.1 AzlC family ABC transporter permease [Pseudomonas sp. 5P_3.1_Bac2]